MPSGAKPLTMAKLKLCLSNSLPKHKLCQNMHYAKV